MLATNTMSKNTKNKALSKRSDSLGSVITDAIQNKNVSLAKSYLNSNPPKHEWQKYHALCILALAELQFEKAIDYFKTAALFDDCEFEVFANLTKLLISKSLHKEAISYAKKAHKLKPDDIQIGRLLINSMLDSEIGPEIIKICDYYLDLYPEDSEIKLAKASTIRFFREFWSSILVG